MQKKRLLIIAFIVVLILLIPLIAMQFTDEVNWTLIDFVIAGFLLFSVVFLFDIILKKVNKSKPRIFLWIALSLVFLLAWAELAVGIFGTPFAGS